MLAHRLRRPSDHLKRVELSLGWTRVNYHTGSKYAIETRLLISPHTEIMTSGSGTSQANRGSST